MNANPNRKKFIKRAAIALGLALLCLVFTVLYRNTAAMLRSQGAARAFRGDSETPFAQVSAFFPSGKGITPESIYTFRETMEQKYRDVNLAGNQASGGKKGQKPQTDENPLAKLMKDGWSARSTITIQGQKGSAETVVYGVGGDFFYFHPLLLRSGAYIREGDLTNDGVVIDEELAWRLYGGVDLAGLPVVIGGEPYIIAGVVSREKDYATKAASSDGTVMYMAYERLNAVSPTEINAYEAVAADPIDGFVKTRMTETFPNAAVVENSARFTVLRILEVIRSFGKRSMHLDGVIYPYWENAALFTEDVLAVLLIAAVLTAVYPVFAAIRAAVLLTKSGVKKLREKIPELLDEADERRYQRMLEKKGSGGKR